MNTPGTHGAPARMLTFRSGGWVLLMAGVFTLIILVWAVAGAYMRLGSPLVGDGRDVESYGFDLRNCLVPRDLLVAGGLRKDALRSLDDPEVVRGDDVERINADQHGKFLVSTDRVIGVTLNDESRAYPLLIMQCHEIANDTLGGVPIAVTYNPLCDAVVVFERRVDGEVLEFGVSGLLYNSNLLMYDRRPDAAGESLWCQLLGRAVTGPRAETRLTVLNATVTEWGRWFANHPGTTVLRREPRMAKRYQETSYDSYFRSAKLMFPVSPEAPADGPGPKDRLIVVDAGGQRGVFLTEQVSRRAGAAGATGTTGSWQTRLGDTTLLFKARPGSRSVTVTTVPPGRPITTIHAMWFAWHSMYPQEQPIGAGVEAP